eukprot:CAMPEP_0173238354 /NCGR_PEP_ID=MMETSP1142-20121109/12590_1 /TAXON_ID=483371 /ORGANISM="non described non described, Strain CCMP2298" /LENGTH=56 /DNA_ID=CAMNT_0014169207 /DNA_START=818 /DNA_END=986 /DNA_ORIENTATION=-
MSPLSQRAHMPNASWSEVLRRVSWTAGGGSSAAEVGSDVPGHQAGNGCLQVMPRHT